MSVFLPIEKSLLGLDRPFAEYGASNTSQFVEALTNSCKEIQQVHLGPLFLNSLNSQDKVVVLSAIGDFVTLHTIALEGGLLPIRGLCAILRPESAAREGLHVLRLEKCRFLMVESDVSDEESSPPTGNENPLEELYSCIQNHPTLQEFSMVNFDFVNENEEFTKQKLDGLIRSICTLPNLKILRLEASPRGLCTFDGNTMGALFQATKAQLVELSLAHFALTKMHHRFLVWGIRKEPLHKLGLKFVDLDDDDLAKMAFYLKNCRQLQDLDLSGNRFGNTGTIALAKELAQSASLTSLTMLDNNKIGKEGYKSLAEMVENNTRISRIELSPDAEYRDVMQTSLEKNLRNTRAALAA